tara:strand:+ start:2131 stop:2526 length:396 start_codon:yes stop_codon:yes gene_type:complete
MKNYKNNHKRNRFRNHSDRNYKRNGNGHKLNSDFANVSDFKRKNPGRNNQNAGKLIEKYNELAREALSQGDKILSENYLQHADHFARISEKQLIEKNAEKNLEGAINSNFNKEAEENQTEETDKTIKISKS